MVSPKKGWKNEGNGENFGYQYFLFFHIFFYKVYLL